MVFRKIKKWDFRETWFNKSRKTGIIAYIHHTPKSALQLNGFYHFSISCTEQKRKNLLNSDCIKYNSLDEGINFDTYEACKDALEKWYKKNL